MLSNPTGVNTTDFINGSRTTSGVLFTFPPGKYFSVDIQLSASQSGAGTAAPVVSFNTISTPGTFSPANGSIVSRLEVTGLLGVTAADSNTIEFSGYSGDNGATLDFVASGISSAVVNGFVI